MRGIAVVFVAVGVALIALAVSLGSTSEDEGVRAMEAATASSAGGGFLPPPERREVESDPAPAREKSQGIPGPIAEEPSAGTGEPGGASDSPGGSSGMLPPPETSKTNTQARAQPATPRREPPPYSAAHATLSYEREVDLAAALAHGSSGKLGERLATADLPDARRGLVRAFLAALDRRSDASDLEAALEGQPEVSAGEIAMVRAMRTRQRSPLAFTSSSLPSPIGRAMRMASLELAGAEHLAQREHAEAARCYSELLLSEVDSPWRESRESLARWSAALQQAQRGHRFSQRGDWPSIEAEVRSGDSLVRVRKRVLAENPGMKLCTGMIDRFNQLGGRYIHPGDKLRIPTDRPSALVDLSARWAFYLLGDEVVVAWEVGIGKDGFDTETGDFIVGLKQEDPMWFPVGEQPIPHGDPANPLGTRWIEWHRPGGRKTSLGFHGTNDASGVGKPVSRGCIRMHNEHVEELFELLPLGAPLRVQA